MQLLLALLGAFLGCSCVADAFFLSVLKLSLRKPLGVGLEEVKEGVAEGVKVLSINEGGSAFEDGRLQEGMLLREVAGQDVTERSFDQVMDLLIGAPAETPLDLVFEKSEEQEKEEEEAAAAAAVAAAAELAAAAEAAAAAAEEAAAAAAKLPMGAPVTLDVKAPNGKQEATISTRVGLNLRKVLLENKVGVYDGMAKMTNCNGAGQCGTCAVALTEGTPEQWFLRSEYEEGKLKGRPQNQRLACQTVVQGDAEVVVRPPKK